MSEGPVNRRLLWSVGAVVVVVAAGAGVWLSTGGDDAAPEDVVERYLSSVRSGDTEDALSLTGWRPEGDVAAFLTPESLSAEWTVGGVVEVDNDGTAARVEATLSSLEAAEVTGVFDLFHTGDSWRLDMPYAEVGLGDVGVDYFEVNGRDQALTTHPAYQRYLLFPGLYRFYADDNSSLDISAEPRLLLPGDDVTRVEAQITVTDTGVESAQLAVDAYIDECARATSAYVESCPFSADPHSLDTLVGVDYMNAIRDVEWEVRTYPVIDVEYSGGRFKVTDAEVGEVELSATGTERIWDSGTREFYDGDDIDFTIDCRIEATWLDLTVGPDGVWTVSHRTDFETERDWRPGLVVETCGAATTY
ncbi:hypothetical protein FB566_2697 [Stackebrandtia endophytica]|uniref:Uncharacterized protein n=1 Tax=Stackebrandtia endophytica TaxID=1496996 RepID=A0A543AX47_9ACTN|nr:hypothetical protein [Stackebrandtia endophytica]TQL77147.1 hypothetical protein FB566_2697 [Stackebrandtia endophytica]